MHQREGSWRRRWSGWLATWSTRFLDEIGDGRNELRRPLQMAQVSRARDLDQAGTRNRARHHRDLGGRRELVLGPDDDERRAVDGRKLAPPIGTIAQGADAGGHPGRALT